MAHPELTYALNGLVERLPSVSVEELPRFELKVRAEWRYHYPEPDAGKYDGVHMLGLLSFHSNGYRREEAVTRLAALDNITALRYLILRMTDWVPQVRERARNAVLERLGGAPAEVIASHFFLLTRAAGSDDGLRQVLARLSGDAHRILIECAASMPGKSERAIFRFLLDSVPDVRRAAVIAAAASKDALIRAWATPFVDSLPLLLRLAADRVPAVRRRAMTTLSESFPGEARQLFGQAVLDRSATVRELARRFLGPGDYAAIYREAIAAAHSARTLGGALGGLAETGKHTDADVAAELLGHPTPSVRRAAVKCVMRLAGDAYAERITAMLADPSPGVSAAVRDLLRRRPVDRQAIVQFYTPASEPYVRRNAVSLFAVLPKWESITALLVACTDADEEVSSLALRFVRDWNRNYNRRQVPPSPSEVERLATVFATVEPELDRTITDDLRFIIRSLSPAPEPPPRSRR